MELNLSIGKATLIVDANSSGDIDDFVGESIFFFSMKELNGLLPHNQSLVYYCNEERLPEWSKDKQRFIASPDKTVYIGHPDLAIYIFHVMAETGGTFRLSWDGGSVYWLFHDIHHATHDVIGETLEVNGSREEEALYGGAVSAHNNGIPLSEIMRQLMKSEKEFKDRFGYENKVLTRFLDTLVSHA